MQLRNRITVVRNVRIHHLSLLKARHKTQMFSVYGCGRNGIKKQHSNNWEAIQFILDSIRFVSEHLELLEQRATASAGKPESTLCGIAKNSRPSFFLGSLFGSCLDCFLIFVLTRHECVAVFIKCFSFILLCFILCLVLILRSGKPS